MFIQHVKEMIARKDASGDAWILRYCSSIELKGNDLFSRPNSAITDVDAQISLLDLLCDLAE